MHGERLDELHRGGRFREDQEPLALQDEPEQSLPPSVAFADDDTDARTFGGHVSLHDGSLLRSAVSPLTPMSRSSSTLVVTLADG